MQNGYRSRAELRKSSFLSSYQFCRPWRFGTASICITKMKREKLMTISEKNKTKIEQIFEPPFQWMTESPAPYRNDSLAE